MKRLALLLPLLLVPSIALAETAPFDMSGERQSVTPEATAPASPVTIATPVETPPPSRHYILPTGETTLSGETDRRVWSLNLDAATAASATVLSLGYSNAVMVAPELSTLTVTVNDQQLASEAIQAVEKPATLRLTLPPGLLKSGPNRFAVTAKQRHRTDCTIASTYELWTRLDPATSFLEPANGGADNSLDAIRAVGVDANGVSRFTILAPALDQPAAVAPLLRLSQALSLAAAMPRQAVSFVKGALPPAAPGQLALVVGTPAEVAALLPNLPASSADKPFIGLVPHGGAMVLAIVGPDWGAIASLVSGLLPASAQSDAASLATAAWQAPDAPLVTGDRQLSLAELGLRTEEFSGRQFHADVAFALPGDFYANAYGEMIVRLDAAFSPEVRAGSRFNIYVNGHIASSVPINAVGGSILKSLPVRVTMRHLRPGLNRLTFEADLATAADAACLPGATATAAPRFALFDTTSIDIPRFARAGQRPDLAALTAIGYPLATGDRPVALYLDHIGTDTLSAAGTLLGKLALKAGRPIDVQPTTALTGIAAGPAVLIAAADHLPPDVLVRFNIAADVASRWPSGAPTGATTPAATLNGWRDRLAADNGNPLMRAVAWVRSNFDLSSTGWHLAAGVPPAFLPDPSTSVLAAAGDNPAGDADWLLVTTPDGAHLVDGVETLTREANWQRLSGYVSAYAPAADRMDSASLPTRFVGVGTSGLANLRLIAANWLSSNLLAFVGLVLVFAVLLAATTTAMHNRFGRRN